MSTTHEGRVSAFPSRTVDRNHGPNELTVNANRTFRDRSRSKSERKSVTSVGSQPEVASPSELAQGSQLSAGVGPGVVSSAETGRVRGPEYRPAPFRADVTVPIGELGGDELDVALQLSDDGGIEDWRFEKDGEEEEADGPILTLVDEAIYDTVVDPLGIHRAIRNAGLAAEEVAAERRAEGMGW